MFPTTHRYPKQRRPQIGEDPQRVRTQYQELKEVILEVDKEAMEILTRTPSRFATFSIRSPQLVSAESHSTFTWALLFPCP